MTDDPTEHGQQNGHAPGHDDATRQPRWMAPSLLVAAVLMVVLVVLLV